MSRLYYKILALANWINNLIKGRKYLRTESDIDGYLIEVHQAFEKSHSDGRSLFNRYAYDSGNIDLHFPPDSAEYKYAQFEIYKTISGRDYDDVACEQTHFDLESSITHPYPYSTQNPSLVGEHISSYGFLMKCVGSAFPSSQAGKKAVKLLEFGFGWGNNILNLSSCGFDLTGVDISEAFCQLLKKNLEVRRLKANVECASMLEFQTEQRFDGIIFNESFHHCTDHIRMLERCKEFLKPGGCIFFNAEPITRTFPMPWGLRLDGESVWAIRSHGWFELGFNRRYFDWLLQKKGFVSRTLTASNHSMLSCTIATLSPCG